MNKVILKTRKKNELELLSEQYYLDLKGRALYLNEQLKYQEFLVNYIAGFDKNDIPGAIRHGILMHIAEMQDRESVSSIAISLEIKNLYLPYRQLRI